jgi:hypothetical protein
MTRAPAGAPAPRSTAVIVIAITAVLAGLVAGCGHHAATPGIGTLDLRPTVELVVRECPPAASTSPGCDQGDLSVRPTGHPTGAPVRSVGRGTVLSVENQARTSRRVQGTTAASTVFDTGTMRPGEHTTVLLQTPGPILITEMPGSGRTTLTVRVTSPPKS